jgi:hypothetical protein
VFNMNSVTLRLLAVTGILAFEAALIILDIPELNLVAGAALLAAIMALASYRFLSGRIQKRRETRSGSATQAGLPAIEAGAGTGGDSPLSSAPRPIDAGTKIKTPPAGSPADPGILHSMGKGFGLLLHSLKSSLERTGSRNPAPEMAGPKPDPKSSAKPTLAALNLEPAAPVGVKREPSPFSSLEKKMDLDADLIHTRSGLDHESSPGVIQSDVDLDAGEIFAPGDEIALMDISLNDETPITIDEEQDDEVSQILDAYQDELPDISGGDQDINFNQEFDRLDNIDLGDLVPGSEEGETPAPASPETMEGRKKPVSNNRSSPGSTKPASRAAPEEPGFRMPATGDEDLISSLRTDISGKKRDANLSLLRELKDVRVQIGEIENDINELLALSKKFK